MQGYETFNKIRSLYNLSEYGLYGNYKKIEKLIDLGEIDGKKINGVLYISTESIERYVEKVDRIRKDYITAKQFALELIEDKSELAKFSYISDVIQFAEKVGLDVLVLEVPISGTNEQVFIGKKSFQNYKRDYISITEASKTFSGYSRLQSLKNAFVRRGIQIVSFKEKYNLQYIKRIDLERLKLGVSFPDVLDKLGVTYATLRKVLKQNNMSSYMGRNQFKYLSKDNYEYLVQLQETTYKDVVDNYYTYDDIERMLLKEVGFKRVNSSDMKYFSVDIPTIARIHEFKDKYSIYRREDVDSYINQLKKEKQVYEVIDSATSHYDTVLKNILELERISFCPTASITEDYWFQFAYKKLKNTKGSLQSNRKKIMTFLSATKVLVEMTRAKEIHEFNEEELNLAIFNDNVPRTYQKELYSFIYNLNLTTEQNFNRRLFDMNKINYNGSEYIAKIKKEKEIYTVDQYLSLYRFVKDYETHKALCIEDVRNALVNNNEYKKRDSLWLYILLHMNNGWRKTDVINFPRLVSPVFDDLNLTDIESLEKLQITIEDANKIVKYYQIQWFQHNKNGQKATFHCSSELIIPMAYAILICEFRCRHIDITEQSSLIKFYSKNNHIKDSVYSTFLTGDMKGFKFESRKMNRTVLTLTSAVIRQRLNNDPIQIARHLRGHTTAETTNIYIQVPQEHLDFIAEQLFDTGYFGYIYDQVGTLLAGETPQTRLEQTQRAVALRELLGDVVKLEDMSSYLQHLSREREDLGRYLEDFSKEEIQEKVAMINMGLFPAKEKCYQCFFSDCIAKSKDCNRCPFSIPHFYSLSVICERIQRNIKKYLLITNQEGTPEGEKIKLFNLVISDYDKILSAQQKFGTEIIEMFLNNHFKEFDATLDELPEPVYVLKECKDV